MENVASMDEAAAMEISELLGACPYRMDSADAVPMHRPRYAWSSETLEEKIAGVFVERIPTSSWLQEGFEWKGETSGTVFPTCMKAMVPPQNPAGLHKCDSATVSRWKGDEYRYPPYQYKSCYLLTRGRSWRLLSPPERELLLGYGIGHTRACLSASEAKGNATF